MGGGCSGTTDVLMIFLQPSLSSDSLRVLARGSSVHSLMLSCQHFFGLPRLLPPGTVPCMMVFASPVARVTRPYHLSSLVLTMKRRSSCGPIAALTRFLTSSFVILSLNEIIIVIALKAQIERLEPSPTRKLKWPGRNRVQITCSTSRTYAQDLPEA